MVGANIHDSRLVGFTIESNSDIVTRFELCCGGFHLCLDKGYDYKRVNDEVCTYGFEAHIRSRGEEKLDQEEKRHPARRWVVERTISWLKGFRGIRTRYCRKLSTFVASVKLGIRLDSPTCSAGMRSGRSQAIGLGRIVL